MVSLHDDTKRRFDDLKPDDRTQDEFVQDLLNAYEQREGVDPENWADQVAETIAKKISPKAELGSYRGAKSALEEFEK